MKTPNLIDWIMFSLIAKVMTQEEWHSFWSGFFDGFSLQKEGKWTKKLAKKCGVKDHYVLQKTHYYNEGYATGEWSARLGMVLLAVLAKGLQQGDYLINFCF